ncbi:oligosaccharide flippase family protein [Falsiroseomonas sp. CW058]|uniref:oligosaccharide flippase family protein n=1 Tax=Falsiroseomonas sp. CW058 TaxID=3388664 RepID=UPI003D31E4DF
MAVFSLVSMLVIGRVIGPEATGIGMVAVAAFTLLDVAGATLFTDSLVQYPRLTRRHGASALTGAVLVGGVAGVLLAVLAPWLAGAAEAPQAMMLCLALAPLLPISAFSGAGSGLVLREQRFALLACRVLLGQPLALGIGLGLAANGFGPWAMVASQAVATLSAFLLLLVFGRLPLRPMLDRAAIADLWPIAGPQVVALAVLIGRYRLFLVVLGVMVTEAVLAVSHFAFRMLDAALVMVWQATGRIAMPRLCALQHDREALAESFGDLAQLQALLGMPLAAGIALTAPDLVQALLGPQWYEVGRAAQIVGLAATLTFVHGDTVSLFVARGKPRWNVAINTAALVVPLVALLVLRPATPAGVAASWAAQALVMPPVLTWLVLREVRRPLSWLLKRLAPAVVATGAMGLAVVSLELTVHVNAMGELLLAATVGGAVYVAVAWAMLGGRIPPALLRRPASGALPAE